MGNRALQPVSINGIEFDALISSTEAYEASVPEYPVETGFTVSDTVILNAETLEMTLFLSNRPVTWARRFGASANRVGQVTRQLRELYFQKSLVPVSTGSGSYTNMAIQKGPGDCLTNGGHPGQLWKERSYRRASRNGEYLSSFHRGLRRE